MKSVARKVRERLGFSMIRNQSYVSLHVSPMYPSFEVSFWGLSALDNPLDRRFNSPTVWFPSYAPNRRAAIQTFCRWSRASDLLSHSSCCTRPECPATPQAQYSGRLLGWLVKDFRLLRACLKSLLVNHRQQGTAFESDSGCSALAVETAPLVGLLSQSRSSVFKLISSIAISMGSWLHGAALAQALLALSIVSWPSAFDEREHRPDVHVAEDPLVCRHIGFIARYDRSSAVLGHLEQLLVRMVPRMSRFVVGWCR